MSIAYDIGTHDADARDAESFLAAAGAGRIGRLPRRVLLTVTRDTPDAERVAGVHARLSDAGVPGVPRLFFAGPISGRRFAIVTEVLRGRAPDASPEDYVAVEKTVCSLWLAGVAHGALVPDWFVVSDDGDSPRRSRVATVRDLGHAIELPRSASSKNLSGRDLDAAVARANAAVRLATPEFASPDGDFLRDMYSRVPREDRARIVQLREAAWFPASSSSSSSADLSGLTSLFMSPF
jgi:hypothetical protein